MVLQVSNRTRFADSENTPPIRLPTTTTKVRNGIQAASRRRRARVSGSYPQYAVKLAKKQQQRTKTKAVSKYPPPSVDVEMHDVSASGSVQTKSVLLPRYLSRPEFREVSRETLRAVDPELTDSNTHPDYIREGLEHFGPAMLRVLSSVQAQPVTNVLPKELSIIINDLSSDLPTHMLAVYARQSTSSAAVKRRVTLFPTHNVVLAANCASLPTLPASIPVSASDMQNSPASINVPIVPLCIPSPETFPQLSTFLYTKRADHLLASLLPSSSLPLSLLSASPLPSTGSVKQYATSLATAHTPQTLLAHAMSVNGLWRNVCALGVFDERLWDVMDIAWEVLLGALGVATGKGVAL
ncbi:hypothetical protein BV22DRAFT_1058048 [Leucogyrophana mollusca]|uniref:Uncharacterized protein n=1 Tax=Leucogyrophana mollusca TaxID=85980 RepID=A0ACB8BSB9_9AGAM|nr:hypothetical protein BV22DRAFT_1058048 [Leucogyrophana mollusca]